MTAFLCLCALLASCAAALREPAGWTGLRTSSSGALHPERPAAAAAPGGGGAPGDSSSGSLPPALRYEHETMQHLVEGSGYPLEEHFVTTADGYVLGVYRIPQGSSSPPGSSRSPESRRGGSSSRASTAGAAATSGAAPCRPPVLLLHGLLDSSAAWVLNEPSQSLGFILADAGFDVWLGNSRGSVFSRNHTGLDPRRAAFWDFSWDDMATNDMPAMVQHILERSCGGNASRVAYIGHSQGTTQMFAALASNPALRTQLSVAVMLAPAVHMRGIQALPMQVLAAMNADKLFNIFGAYEFLPTRKAAADLFGELCRTTPWACASVITAISGFNPANMNLSRLPTAVQYAPSGTSVKNMAHWAQAIRKSRERQMPLFQMYDYENVCMTPAGLPHTCNMRVYHTIEPPSYDLGAISSPPLAIFAGGVDHLADPADVQTLLEALPPDSIVYKQFEPSYGHLDFTWGIDAHQRIYPAVLQLLQRYSPA